MESIYHYYETVHRVCYKIFSAPISVYCIDYSYKEVHVRLR